METFNTIEVKSNWLKLENIGDGYIATVNKITEGNDPQGDQQTIVELINVTKLTTEGGKKVTNGPEITLEGGEIKEEKLADDNYVIGFKNSKTFIIKKIEALSPGDRCKIVYTGQYKTGKPQPAKTIDILKGPRDLNFKVQEDSFDEISVEDIPF